MSRDQIKQFEINTIQSGQHSSDQDDVAVEEPLEIRLLSAGIPDQVVPVAITMRTPGHDFELAAGYLLSEGIIASRTDLVDVNYCLEKDNQQNFNIVTCTLANHIEISTERFSRNTLTNSSCGICGRGSIELVQNAAGAPLSSQILVSADMLHQLPGKLLSTQSAFAKTGGLHAAAHFDGAGNCISLYEDVGRHNAMDKLVGNLILATNHLLDEQIVLVSGRASFELVQKAIIARASLLLAIGAPSSLAIELANEFNLTLVGFATAARFNVYSGSDRISFQ